MASDNEEYSVDSEILQFFAKASATRSECDALAKQLTGGSWDVVPVAVQGVCSYTVYAGQNQEFVAQFRLKSLSLKLETGMLARKIHGSLAPEVSFHGEIGKEADGKEPLLVYTMTRIQGISHLDFILSHNILENSPQWFTWRESLLTDMAKFFALSWKQPQSARAGTDPRQ
ncbi:hypothetical protein F4808DRAFT_293324 [Astrocystis sublimbata]|nr:hypothetical protein F4808DRAFT_293324 [Astrocystis sublimbata]